MIFLTVHRGRPLSKRTAEEIVTESRTKPNATHDRTGPSSPTSPTTSVELTRRTSQRSSTSESRPALAATLTASPTVSTSKAQ